MAGGDYDSPTISASSEAPAPEVRHIVTRYLPKTDMRGAYFHCFLMGDNVVRSIVANGMGDDDIGHFWAAGCFKEWLEKTYYAG